METKKGIDLSDPRTGMAVLDIIDDVAEFNHMIGYVSAVSTILKMHEDLVYCIDQVKQIYGDEGELYNAVKSCQVDSEKLITINHTIEFILKACADYDRIRKFQDMTNPENRMKDDELDRLILKMRETSFEMEENMKSMKDRRKDN